jgi:hypothetical protein
MKSLVDINQASMDLALKSIVTMVNERVLILTGELTLSGNPNFPSQNKKKEFRKRLNWVIEKPTMKRVSMFLRMYAQFTGTQPVKVDFSPKEKQIQEARKAYVEARKKAQEAHVRYKEEKGDFYKSIRLKVC